MKLDAKGYNEYGVLFCECKPYGPPHAYEPGEWCSPVHVLPKACKGVRLRELADICETRKLTTEEFDECFDLSVGAETVEQVEQMLAEEER